MRREAILTPYLFDGETMRANVAVLIVDGRIEDLAAAADLPRGTRVVRPERGEFLAPALVDLQVNGGGGVLFNDALDVGGLAAITAAHRASGTGIILPTLISGSCREIAAAMDAVRAAIERGIPGIAGLHVEGPAINARRRGIHPERAVRPLGAVDLGLLTAPFPAPLVLTLAPEIVPIEALEELRAAGVILLAGHTEAEPKRVAAARRAGLVGFTHLFNAMPPLAARIPGPAGAALADRDAFASLIVDGRHVDPTMLRLAIAAKGVDHVFLVSDAMPSVGSASESFRLGDKTITLADGRLTDAAGTLAGAHLSLGAAVENVHRLVGVAPADALRMATAVPARCAGLEARFGSVRPGRSADLALFDAGLRIVGSWTAGVYAAATPVGCWDSQAATSPAF